MPIKETIYCFERHKVPIKIWASDLEEEARQQLNIIGTLPFIYKHVAVMPDAHAGKGSTIGSVIPTKGVIIPATVGVDIGCGMIAQKLSLNARDLPDNLHDIRNDIEKAVPCGRTHSGQLGDLGAWASIPDFITYRWKYYLKNKFDTLCEKHSFLHKSNSLNHLGTLGTGNHFIEICLDENDFVWVMLHSGSRGIGNKIGNHFIDLAKKDMQRYFIKLPDHNLSYLVEGSSNFNDYVEAVEWAQKFATHNRLTMMQSILNVLYKHLPNFYLVESAINVHHNYVRKENHFNENIWVTRKGATSAREGEMGIIPGSMGEKSFIVEWRGNLDSFKSCSHGAGRAMSRNEARRRFTIDDLIKETSGIECRKDEQVIDEIPSAYKPIDVVMHDQTDLVKVRHTLKQILNIKG